MPAHKGKTKDGADSRSGLLMVTAKAEREANHHDAADNGVNADHPDDRERAVARENHDNETEQDGQGAEEDKHPLIVDLAPDRDRPRDLEHAADDRPDADEG